MEVQRHFIRYAVVGITSNGVSYLLYLLATWIGVGPKVAMTGVYALSVLQTFFFNKRWSFRFDGAAAPALVRYAVAYAVGYVVNLLALLLLVDQARLPHQLIQGVMILVVAVMLFMAQRYWVFPQASRSGVA
jgi:putative flippase GtrA